MKIYLPLLLTIAVLTACSKSSNPDCDARWINIMNEKWETESGCTSEFKPYLAKGKYRSTTIYYTSISCVTCNVAPPQYGVNCAGDSIKIDNWNNVQDNQVIATCRGL